MSDWPNKGTLWVNPFLNNFYEWGVGKWWHNKKNFLLVLDNPKYHLYPYTHAIGVTWEHDYLPNEITKYIVEKVPKWYWEGNMHHVDRRIYSKVDVPPFEPMMYMNISAFGGVTEGPALDKLLHAWESNEPFSTDVNFFPLSFVEKVNEQYIGYPEYLQFKGDVLLSHRYLNQYVRLIDVDTRTYNSIYFTTVKDKSWCDTHTTTNFLNWNQTNPMEVKE